MKVDESESTMKTKKDFLVIQLMLFELSNSGIKTLTVNRMKTSQRLRIGRFVFLEPTTGGVNPKNLSAVSGLTGKIGFLGLIKKRDYIIFRKYPKKAGGRPIPKAAINGFGMKGEHTNSSSAILFPTFVS